MLTCPLVNSMRVTLAVHARILPRRGVPSMELVSCGVALTTVARLEFYTAWL